MAIYKRSSTEISNMQSDLLLGFHQGLKFNCNLCNRTGEELLCVCNNCKKSMHPSCAGVKTGTVYDKDGTKRVVLPASEKLPKSCRNCLRETNGIMMINQLCVQQRSFEISSSGSSSGNSITSFIESGMEPAHRLLEGDNFFMTHRHKPSHQLKRKDNWTNYNCSGCKIEGFGEHYECENASCSFLLHKECMSPRKTIKHQFFPGLNFAFSCLHSTSSSKHGKKVHTNIFCNACRLEVNGYFYHSMDGTINFHPCCINLPRKITCGLTGAEMVLRRRTTSRCDLCNKLIDQMWSYVAESDSIHYHIQCVIKILPELKRDSMGQLISCKMSCKNGVGKMDLQLVLHDAKTKCAKNFKTFMKYAKMALGAVIGALLGDATTLLVTTMVAIASK